MSVQSEGQELWNVAYNRGGNICFYPHEEVIRFVNKYVRKREGISQFKNVMPKIGGGTASLDLGCGIGRHVKFLDEFGLNPYGVDLSDTAVNMGKCWMKSIGKEELSQKLIVSSVVDLPFKDEYFDVCISCGVLDSMPRDIAKAGMREAYRVMKQEGLMYLDLIMDSNRGDVDEIVNCGYEKNTIQSYFTIDSIKDFIGSEWEILEFKVITCQLEGEYECDKRAHLIIKKR